MTVRPLALLLLACAAPPPPKSAAVLEAEELVRQATAAARRVDAWEGRERVVPIRAEFRLLCVYPEKIPFSEVAAR